MEEAHVSGIPSRKIKRVLTHVEVVIVSACVITNDGASSPLAGIDDRPLIDPMGRRSSERLSTVRLPCSASQCAWFTGRFYLSCRVGVDKKNKFHDPPPGGSRDTPRFFPSVQYVVVQGTGVENDRGGHES